MGLHISAVVAALSCACTFALGSTREHSTLRVVAAAQAALREGCDAEKVVRRACREATREACDLAEGRQERARLSSAVLGVAVHAERLRYVDAALCADSERYASSSEPLERRLLALLALGCARDDCSMTALDDCHAVPADERLREEEAEAARYVGRALCAEMVAASPRAVREMLSSRAPAAVAARLSVSARLLAAFRRALGAELACDYLRSCNTRGPATLRRNALGGRDAVSFVELLARDGIAVRKNQRSPLAFDVVERGRVSLQSTEAWRRGLFEVQAESSQVACLATRAAPGERVLDYCAGRGGKAFALCAMVAPAGSVAVRDVDASALQQLFGSAARVGATDLPHYDLLRRDPLDERGAGEPFDAVLVDAPCSSSGVLRRHPSSRHAAIHCDPAELCELQLAILTEAATRVRAGGRLLYATCSVLPEENHLVTRAFARAHRDTFAPLCWDEQLDSASFEWDPLVLHAQANARLPQEHALQQHELLLLPNVHGEAFDGFFMARFERIAQ